MSEMYRVTRAYRGVGVHTTVTISTRLEAESHQDASTKQDIHIRAFVLRDLRDWTVTKIAVQNEEQIERGEWNES